jgi:hypothetical protein
MAPQLLALPAVPAAASSWAGLRSRRMNCTAKWPVASYIRYATGLLPRFGSIRFCPSDVTSSRDKSSHVPTSTFSIVVETMNPFLSCGRPVSCRYDSHETAQLPRVLREAAPHRRTGSQPLAECSIWIDRKRNAKGDTPFAITPKLCVTLTVAPQTQSPECDKAVNTPLTSGKRSSHL